MVTPLRVTHPNPPFIPPMNKLVVLLAILAFAAMVFSITHGALQIPPDSPLKQLRTAN